MNKVCRLCLTERSLIRAHVIPKAFWPLDDGTPKVLSNRSGTYPSRSPQGVYDSEILCERCNTELLGPLDQHAAEKLLRGKFETLRVGTMAVRCYGEAEAARIFLFVASVAWRASISKHTFFARVSLARYEEVIRKCILDASEFQDDVEAAIAEFDEVGGFIDPHQTRFEGVRFSVIYADRFVFYLKTDRRLCPSPLSEILLRSERPVFSLPRQWRGSKERDLLQRIARSHPNAFPKR